MIINPLKTGPWNLTDLKKVQPNGMKVFSCFHCGGGSTMGYKLAGFEVLGGVEIDPEMSTIYVNNHNPKYEYLMGVKEFNKIPNDQLPAELFELDILDGSPPCSSFSMAGSREKKWGEKKKFREGQAEQVLDDLFFDFIDIAEKLQPKVVVAENVKGLIQGNARGYVKQIFKKFREIGYACQLFLLNSAAMGVPQRRERTFFIANRIGLNKIKLEFNETIIPIKNVFDGETRPAKRSVKRFGDVVVNINNPINTIATINRYFINDNECISGDINFSRLQSFPDDYRYTPAKSIYVCGMSVPPFMMQRVADQIYKQWLWPNICERINNG